MVVEEGEDVLGSLNLPLVSQQGQHSRNGRINAALIVEP